MGTLNGRVSIVTGGARGIGRAYCLGLAEQGSAVVVADLVDGRHVVAEIEEAGGKAVFARVDVSVPESTYAMARTAVEHFRRVDILVNNAAFYKQVKHGPFSEIDVDEWDKTFAVNVKGVWLCCRAVYPYMREQEYGKIINISSNTVWKGVPNFLHYVASKSAILGLTRSLAAELGKDNIAVNTVAPDFIPDENDLRERGDRADEVVQERCFKRRQEPGDVVGLVVFLAGPTSDFITGQSFLVNGGAHFQ